MVRIPFPPAVSRQTIGSSAARQPAPEGELLTIKKAAVVLGVAPSTIHRLLNDGVIAGEQPTPGALGVSASPKTSRIASTVMPARTSCRCARQCARSASRARPYCSVSNAANSPPSMSCAANKKAYASK